MEEPTYAWPSPIEHQCGDQFATGSVFVANSYDNAITFDQSEVHDIPQIVPQEVNIIYY